MQVIHYYLFSFNEFYAIDSFILLYQANNSSDRELVK